MEKTAGMQDIIGRFRRGNQLLVAKNSPFLEELAALLESRDHQTVVLWALDLAEETVKELKKRYPDEDRPSEALRAARLWASGTVKMREAQRAILNCHAFAKETTDPEEIALCHGIGQACGTVHTAGHAIGFPVYELTALVHRFGIENCEEPLRMRREEYTQRLLYWEKEKKKMGGSVAWAEFMKR